MRPEPLEPDDVFDPEEGPTFRAQRDPEQVPAFCERVLDHLLREEPVDDFTIERVDVETAAGVWLAPISAYLPEEDSPSTSEQIAAGAGTAGSYGKTMIGWADDARRAMRDAWGEPAVHAPRLVGADQEPEGILDYLLVAQEFADAELWDRGTHFFALPTQWSGEPGTSMLRQILIILPREFVMSGLSLLLDDEDTAVALLMHGENLEELRRRAWIMSAAFGQGEVRLRDTPIDACRYSLQARGGTTTVWTFADDGRVLVLILDPECDFARTAAEQFERDNSADGQAIPDARLIVVERLLEGIPTDLRACVAARGETVSGAVADNLLEFDLLDDRPVPVISGAFWYDGETWRATRGLLETAARNGFGMDSFGVAAAIRRPYRLGGEFDADRLTPINGEHRAAAEQLVAACPYPEQPRPEGDLRLGQGIPRATRGGIVDDIERVTALWWDRTPDDGPFAGDDFRIGGRDLGSSGDPAVLTATLGSADDWTREALEEWTATLITVMSERWGAAREVKAEGVDTGADRRTPLTRVMRGTGLRSGPLWWVDGHAVVLLAGVTATEYSGDPEVILVIARADTVLELLGSMYLYDVRTRARVIRNLASIAASDAPDRRALDAEQSVSWRGPALRGSDLVPRAVRGGLRADRFFWVWHFTHDGRGLLTSHEIGAPRGTFADRAALFAGVPDDLLSLVIDQDPDGLYPLVTRVGEPEAADPFASARSLPDAKAVFFHDGFDWRASEGMLRAARAECAARAAAENEGADAEGPVTVSPLPMLYSADRGVPQLQWVLRVGAALSTRSLASEEFGAAALSRVVSTEEVMAASAQLGTPFEAALMGTLDEMLDVIADRPGYRNVLDAALSNPDPRRRREIALWLLEQDIDASVQLSFLTPVAMLFENPTLGAGDEPVLRRLLESGADAGPGLLGSAGGRHPLVQLCDRDIDEAELLPLLDALLAPYERTSEEQHDGSTLHPDIDRVLARLRDGDLPHGRSREHMRERIDVHAARRPESAA